MLARLHRRLSDAFYEQGRVCASNTLTIVFTVLILLGLLTWPLCSRYLRTLPLTALAPNTAFAPFWQYSPHVHHVSPIHPSPNATLVIQIHMADLGSVTKSFLHRVWSFWDALTSASATDPSISFASVCLPHHESPCVVHSALAYWQDSNALLEDIHWQATVERRRNAQTSTGLPLDPKSVFGNVISDTDGQFVSADSVIFTVFVDAAREHLWYMLWQAVVDGKLAIPGRWIYQQVQAESQVWQYKWTLLVQYIPTEALQCIFCYVILWLGVSRVFANAQMAKWPHGLAMATVLMSIACLAVSIAILDWFNMQLDKVPWYLFFLVANVATVENVLLLTHAAQSAGCDMHAKEKLGRGLASVGIPMTGTLVAELIITAIGYATRVPVIQQLCLFSALALLVDFILQLSFFAAILAIDMEYIELADLEDRQVSKRLRELANDDVDPDNVPVDYCPTQEKNEISCADCKDYKTHRAYFALMLCLLLLTLMLFDPLLPQQRLTSVAPLIPDAQERLETATTFWEAFNPRQEPKLLRVVAPYLVVNADDALATQGQQDILNRHYHNLANALVSVRAALASKRPPSRFRRALYTLASRVGHFLWIHTPLLLLTTALLGIIAWLNRPWREQWLIPLANLTASQANAYLNDLVSWISQSSLGVLRQTRQADYDKNGVHIGAISAQQQFQNKRQVAGVTIKTLAGKHIADVHRFDIHAKSGRAISCGQDGRMVVWDTDCSQWIARLDRMRHTQAGLEGDLNTAYRPHKANAPIRSVPISHPALATARCVKIDRGDKWIAAGFDDGMIRVWHAATNTLKREFRAQTTQDAAEGSVVRNRRRTPHAGDYPISEIDRVIAIAFIGDVPDYCHPQVAKAAARAGTTDPEAAQNYLVSVHKSGQIREWDILTGECTQSFPSNHKRDISLLQAIESKAPHRKLGVTWVFTAGKEGHVKCWGQRLIRDENEPARVVETTWWCAYTCRAHHGHTITSLATALPVGGMGVLVTGASDGSVKVWNFETGEAVCTLSVGYHVKENGGLAKSTIGGPLLQYSQLTTFPDAWEAEETKVSANHAGAISQVVVTRYCDVEGGPGLCRGCDTCFGNGFLIASCSTDNQVHVWRVERTGRGHEGSCTLCSQDYHRKQYTRTRAVGSMLSHSDQNTPPRRQRRSSSSVRLASSPVPRPSRPQVIPRSDDGLLDIEQLAGDDVARTLTSTFLGVIDQLAGRGLAFCHNNILGGVRQKKSCGAEPTWEAWFASLHHYSPPADTATTHHGRMRIPVETFPLDSEEQPELDAVPKTKPTSRFLRFGKGDAVKIDRPHALERPKSKIHDDEDCGEADEMLPFSVVRNVVALDGMGLACDYGNFIKVVYLDNELYQQHKANAQLHVAHSTQDNSSPTLCNGQCGGGDSGACCQGHDQGDGKRRHDCCGGKSRRSRDKPKPAIVAPISRRVDCASVKDCPRTGDCGTSALPGKGCR